MSCRRNATSPGRIGALGRQLLGAPADDPRSRLGGAAVDGLPQPEDGVADQPLTGIERPRELLLFTLDGREDLGSTLGEMRVGIRHDVDHDLGRLGHERLAATQQATVANGPAEDAAEDVAPPLVAGEDVVRDEEGDGPRVIGDDLVAEPLGLEVLRIVAEQLTHAVMDRREQVRVVVRGDLLEDARQALQAHAGVDARCGERRQAPVRMEFELHEHEVPDLEPAWAGLAVVRDAVRSLAERRAPVEVDLRARAARARVRHPPPVLLVPRGKVAPANQTLGWQPDLVAPDAEGHIVRGVRRRGQSLAGDAEVARQEIPGPEDGIALEVVAEAPVPEHLEQGVMARCPADFLEVIVLARDAQATLVVHGARIAALLRTGEGVLELDHAAVREQQCLVAGGNQARTRDDGMTSLGEELDEPSADLDRGQIGDPGVRRRVGGRHRPQWYRTGALRHRTGPERWSGHSGRPRPIDPLDVCRPRSGQCRRQRAQIREPARMAPMIAPIVRPRRKGAVERSSCGPVIDPRPVSPKGGRAGPGRGWR